MSALLNAAATKIAIIPPIFAISKHRSANAGAIRSTKMANVNAPKDLFGLMREFSVNNNAVMILIVQNLNFVTR